ncbi:hypothetical protein WN59_06185 [Salinicoccus sediminis]|uniref:Shikimate kinase n=1 Tax=Salinicoccus sediminis TaxID=1432562 RepID=A0A0M2SNY1_9STAP|nr:AAA family ATPase [Salinicoccus sediminis]KKK33554.1 hypothetical protein WN59_12490 [Salinicoccus sediminis]KKK34627.1 hypothetical protein WN59_06185 [Salinicoccus sediminis]
MKIILIFGPQAVGKMTIGEKVGESLGLPLFHNHVTLDAIWPYIGWNERTFELSDQLRMDIFDHISKDGDHPGIVFTFVWGFDLKDDWKYIDKLKSLFSDKHHKLYFVELEASLEERLKRNGSSYRLEKKPSKRDIDLSKKELLHSVENHRLNSLPGEIEEQNYLRLDVTEIDAQKASEKIIEWIN